MVDAVALLVSSPLEIRVLRTVAGVIDGELSGKFCRVWLTSKAPAEREMDILGIPG